MEMLIDRHIVKSLRNRRSWAQDELASAAGLSLRTVQRIENTGACSLESKRALAAVFEVDAEALEIDEGKADRLQGRRRGMLGVWLGVAGAYVGITLGLITGGFSVGEAGIYYGATAAFGGLCAALIGTLSRRSG